MKGLLVLLTVVVSGIAAPAFIKHPSSNNSHALIVGGRPATQGEIPYQLSIRVYDEPGCGASLIVVQGVTLGISAAHCLPPELPSDSITLVAGDLSLADNSGIEQTRHVTQIVIHEGFDENTYKDDVALLFLDEPFEFNENVQPIPLPSGERQTTGMLKVSGWGRLSYEGPKPDVLQTVEVPVVDHEACQAAYDEIGEEIFETFICAGYLGVGGKDACQGDSGGPALSLDGNYLAGIVSWGEDCGDPNFPGIYTEVKFYIDWINEKVASHLRSISMPLNN